MNINWTSYSTSIAYTLKHANGPKIGDNKDITAQAKKSYDVKNIGPNKYNKLHPEIQTRVAGNPWTKICITKNT